MSKLISVIIPVYKVEKLLPRCLDSVCAQTYRELEIILVDDGSPDNCGKICEEYAKRDSRIRVIHQENGGLASARNAGLEIATGDFLGFVDSDDHIAPEMYEVLMRTIEEENADIAICGRTLEFESGKTFSMFDFSETHVFDRHEAARRFLLSEGFDAAAWDKLYRRRIWKNERYPLHYISEDVPVTSTLLLRSEKIVHCGVPMYFYYQRAGSLSHAAFNEKCAGIYNYYKEAGKKMKEIFPDLKEEASFFYYRALLVLLFRYAGYKGKHPLGEECLLELRKNIMDILKNRFLKKKYKVFALASCLGLGKIAVTISDRFSVNDNSLTQ